MSKKRLKKLESVEEAQERLDKIVKDRNTPLVDKQGRTCMVLHLLSYEGVSKFKSIRRAIRRGHVSPTGIIAPHRPFKNTSPKGKRGKLTTNGYKQQIYGRIQYKFTGVRG